MSFSEILQKERPKITPRLTKQKTGKYELYLIIKNAFDEIEEMQCLGYTWTQINNAMGQYLKEQGKWMNAWKLSDFQSMFRFVKTEREIKAGHED